MAKRQKILDKVATSPDKRQQSTPVFDGQVGQVNDPDNTMWPNGQYATSPQKQDNNNQPDNQQQSAPKTSSQSTSAPAELSKNTPSQQGQAAVPTPMEQLINQASDQAASNAKTITDIYDAAADEVKQAADKYGDNLEAANTVVNNKGLTYSDILQQWELERQKMLQQAEQEAIEQQKRNYNTQVFGGLTEIATNIANLIGTANGAANQPIESKQGQWWERADAVRREHEQRREKYRSQLESIRNQRAQLDYQIAQANADNLRKTAQARYEGVQSAAQYRTKGALAAQQALEQAQQTDLNLKLKAIAQQEERRQNDINNAIRWAQVQTNRERYINSDNTIDINGQQVAKPTNTEIIAIKDKIAQKMGFADYNDYSQARAKNSKSIKRAEKNNKEAMTVLKSLGMYNEEILPTLLTNAEFASVLTEIRGSSTNATKSAAKAGATGYIDGEDLLNELLNQ